MELIERAWFDRSAPVVARDLLNKLLVSAVGGSTVVGRIIEVEAYTQDDPASHTYGGRTRRNAVMFGPSGHLYVYLSYGIHHCVNVVTAPEGSGEAVLIRAVEPVSGVEVMQVRRNHRPNRALADGPGKVGEAFGLDLSHDGVDLTDEASLASIAADGMAPPVNPAIGPRIGISKGIDTLWRFQVSTR